MPLKPSLRHTSSPARGQLSESAVLLICKCLQYLQCVCLEGLYLALLSWSSAVQRPFWLQMP